MPQIVNRPAKTIIMFDNLVEIVNIFHESLQHAGFEVKGDNKYVLAIPDPTDRELGFVVKFFKTSYESLTNTKAGVKAYLLQACEFILDPDAYQLWLHHDMFLDRLLQNEKGSETGELLQDATVTSRFVLIRELLTRYVAAALSNGADTDNEKIVGGYVLFIDKLNNKEALKINGIYGLVKNLWDGNQLSAFSKSFLSQDDWIKCIQAAAKIVKIVHAPERATTAVLKWLTDLEYQTTLRLLAELNPDTPAGDFLDQSRVMNKLHDLQSRKLREFTKEQDQNGQALLTWEAQKTSGNPLLERERQKQRCIIFSFAPKQPAILDVSVNGKPKQLKLAELYIFYNKIRAIKQLVAGIDNLFAASGWILLLMDAISLSGNENGLEEKLKQLEATVSTNLSIPSTAGVFKKPAAAGLAQYKGSSLTRASLDAFKRLDVLRDQEVVSSLIENMHQNVRNIIALQETIGCVVVDVKKCETIIAAASAIAQSKGNPQLLPPLQNREIVYLPPISALQSHYGNDAVPQPVAALQSPRHLSRLSSTRVDVAPISAAELTHKLDLPPEVAIVERENFAGESEAPNATKDIDSFFFVMTEAINTFFSLGITETALRSLCWTFYNDPKQKIRDENRKDIAKWYNELAFYAKYNKGRNAQDKYSFIANGPDEKPFIEGSAFLEGRLLCKILKNYNKKFDKFRYFYLTVWQDGEKKTFKISDKIEPVKEDKYVHTVTFHIIYNNGIYQRLIPVSLKNEKDKSKSRLSGDLELRPPSTPPLTSQPSPCLSVSGMLENQTPRSSQSSSVRGNDDDMSSKSDQSTASTTSQSTRVSSEEKSESNQSSNDRNMKKDKKSKKDKKNIKEEKGKKEKKEKKQDNMTDKPTSNILERGVKKVTSIFSNKSEDKKSTEGPIQSSESKQPPAPQSAKGKERAQSSEDLRVSTVPPVLLESRSDMHAEDSSGSERSSSSAATASSHHIVKSPIHDALVNELQAHQRLQQTTHKHIQGQVPNNSVSHPLPAATQATAQQSAHPMMQQPLTSLSSNQNSAVNVSSASSLPSLATASKPHTQMHNDDSFFISMANALNHVLQRSPEKLFTAESLRTCCRDYYLANDQRKDSDKLKNIITLRHNLIQLCYDRITEEKYKSYSYSRQSEEAKNYAEINKPGHALIEGYILCNLRKGKKLFSEQFEKLEEFYITFKTQQTEETFLITNDPEKCKPVQIVFKPKHVHLICKDGIYEADLIEHKQKDKVIIDKKEKPMPALIQPSQSLTPSASNDSISQVTDEPTGLDDGSNSTRSSNKSIGDFSRPFIPIEQDSFFNSLSKELALQTPKIIVSAETLRIFCNQYVKAEDVTNDKNNRINQRQNKLEGWYKELISNNFKIESIRLKSEVKYYNSSELYGHALIEGIILSQLNRAVTKQKKQNGKIFSVLAGFTKIYVTVNNNDQKPIAAFKIVNGAVSPKKKPIDPGCVHLNYEGGVYTAASTLRENLVRPRSVSANVVQMSAPGSLNSSAMAVVPVTPHSSSPVRASTPAPVPKGVAPTPPVSARGVPKSSSMNIVSIGNPKHALFSRQSSGPINASAHNDANQSLSGQKSLGEQAPVSGLANSTRASDQRLSGTSSSSSSSSGNQSLSTTSTTTPPTSTPTTQLPRTQSPASTSPVASSQSTQAEVVTPVPIEGPSTIIPESVKSTEPSILTIPTDQHSQVTIPKTAVPSSGVSVALHTQTQPTIEAIQPEGPINTPPPPKLCEDYSDEEDSTRADLTKTTATDTEGDRLAIHDAIEKGKFGDACELIAQGKEKYDPADIYTPDRKIPDLLKKELLLNSNIGYIPGELFFACENLVCYGLGLLRSFGINTISLMDELQRNIKEKDNEIDFSNEILRSIHAGEFKIQELDVTDELKRRQEGKDNKTDSSGETLLSIRKDNFEIIKLKDKIDGYLALRKSNDTDQKKRQRDALFNENELSLKDKIIQLQFLSALGGDAFSGRSLIRLRLSLLKLLNKYSNLFTLMLWTQKETLVGIPLKEIQVMSTKYEAKAMPILSLLVLKNPASSSRGSDPCLHVLREIAPTEQPELRLPVRNRFCETIYDVRHIDKKSVFKVRTLLHYILEEMNKEYKQASPLNKDKSELTIVTPDLICIKWLPILLKGIKTSLTSLTNASSSGEEVLGLINELPDLSLKISILHEVLLVMLDPNNPQNRAVTRVEQEALLFVIGYLNTTFKAIRMLLPEQEKQANENSQQIFTTQKQLAQSILLARKMHDPEMLTDCLKIIRKAIAGVSSVIHEKIDSILSMATEPKNTNQQSQLIIYYGYLYDEHTQKAEASVAAKRVNEFEGTSQQSAANVQATDARTAEEAQAREKEQKERAEADARIALEARARQEADARIAAAMQVQEKAEKEVAEARAEVERLKKGPASSSAPVPVTTISGAPHSTLFPAVKSNATSSRPAVIPAQPPQPPKP
jgi:hypothetical protein